MTEENEQPQKVTLVDFLQKYWQLIGFCLFVSGVFYQMQSSTQENTQFRKQAIATQYKQQTQIDALQMQMATMQNNTANLTSVIAQNTKALNGLTTQIAVMEERLNLTLKK